MGKDIAEQLVKFAIETKYEDIPKETLDFTKCLTLKTIAGMLAGSRKPFGRKMAEIIRNKKLPGEVGVIGSGFKTSLWEGVFLNAFFAHASELEDDKVNGGVSWDITVIPLLLPLAEKLGLSGKVLMEALVTGLEVHTRTCLFNSQHLGVILIPGAVGPAVGGAKAFGLGVKETSAALGLAMSGVPLLIQNFGTDAHYFESALQSLQGMMAAEMAKAGLRGNTDIAAYLSAFIGKERVEPEKMVEDLGKRWMLREMWIKKYPVCLIQHRQIDLVIELKKKHNLSFEDVKIIEVHGGPFEEICNRPEPRTEGDLQFSFQHNLSVAMLDGDIGLGRITEDAVDDPMLKEARTKVKFILSPDSSGDISDITSKPARVVIKMKNEKEFSGERLYLIGHPKDPLSIEQFRDLYSKFTKGILSEKEISRTAELILNLEKLGNVKELTNILI